MDSSISTDPRSNAFALRLGEGHISGLLGAFLGVLSVVAVLCFRFPECLMTPERPLGGPVHVTIFTSVDTQNRPLKDWPCSDEWIYDGNLVLR